MEKEKKEKKPYEVNFTIHLNQEINGSLLITNYFGNGMNNKWTNANS